MPTSAWPGDSEPTTSAPRAFSFTRAMKSRTTGRATSASSSAMRTSRSMSWTLSSVMRAWPRIVLTRRLRRSVRVEAMGRRGAECGHAKVHCGDDFIVGSARLPQRTPRHAGAVGAQPAGAGGLRRRGVVARHGGRRAPGCALLVGWAAHAAAIVVDMAGIGTGGRRRAVRLRAGAVGHAVAGARGLRRSRASWVPLPGVRRTLGDAGHGRRWCWPRCSPASSARRPPRRGRRCTGRWASPRTACSAPRCCTPSCSTRPSAACA